MGCRSKGAIALAIVAFITSVQVPASAHKKTFNTSVRITNVVSGSSGRVSGDVDSTNTQCYSGREVRVLRNGSLLGTTRANEVGLYSIDGTTGDGDRITASVAKTVRKKGKKHKHTCTAATSNTVSIPADLVVGIVGNGSVVSQPSGIDCNATNDPCIARFSGTVRLTATAPTGTSFTGWSGACTGATATCTLTMSQDRAVVATFSTPDPPQTRIIEVVVEGPGRVTGPQINCNSDGGDCFGEYPINTQVTLTATANNLLSRFDGWQDACSGTATTCNLTLSRDRRVVGNFSFLLPLPDQVIDLLETVLGLLGPG